MNQIETLRAKVLGNLTPKEQWLFDCIAEGMDDPGRGWLHEVVRRHPNNTTGEQEYNDHQVAGILGRLIEKGLVYSDLYTAEELSVPEDCYFVRLVLPETNA